MPPTPVSSFTIPSIHDDTPLDCRVYHPAQSVNGNLVEPAWQKRGAIIAHPYGPLGGSYDDPVVLSVVAELLKHGLVVGTFNFRGAGSSKGRTSWTAKPELSDYISFAGFFIYFVAGLNPPSISQSVEHTQYTTSGPLSPIQSALVNPGFRSAGVDEGMILILGGYSYGSLITSNLPSTETILASFAVVSKGTAEAEIRLRAMSLSTQWNADVQHHPHRGRHTVPSTLRASPHSAVFGGEESEAGTRRASRESRKSIDLVRRSMDRSLTKVGIRRSSSEGEAAPLETKVGAMDLVVPRTHYLLISPLLPPISMFATMFSNARSSRSEKAQSAKLTTLRSSSSALRTEEKFQRHPTLAIYGDKDFFTSSKKLRRWTEHWMAMADSHFTCREIPGAGHFWHEEGVDGQMRGCIRDWVVDIVGGRATQG